MIILCNCINSCKQCNKYNSDNNHPKYKHVILYFIFWGFGFIISMNHTNHSHSAAEMRRISFEQQKRQCKLYDKIYNRILRHIRGVSNSGDVSCVIIIPIKIDESPSYNREKCFKYVNDKLKSSGYITRSNIVEFSIEIDWGNDIQVDLTTYREEPSILTSVIGEVHQPQLPQSVQETIDKIKMDHRDGITKICRK